MASVKRYVQRLCSGGCVTFVAAESVHKSEKEKQNRLKALGCIEWE